jgi:hypothetical protein
MLSYPILYIHTIVQTKAQTHLALRRASRRRGRRLGGRGGAEEARHGRVRQRRLEERAADDGAPVLIRLVLILVSPSIDHAY